ncbi:MAG: HAD family hydrolase [bacterium]
MKYSAIILDCDGVILDSNNLKSKAMAETVEHYGPDLVTSFVEYHRRNGGVSRYEKFKFFLKEMANSYSKSEYQRLLGKFSKLVKEKLTAVPLTDGAFEFISECSAHSDLYVVSGGDQEELRDVFDQRFMSSYFVDILGSPTKKNVHCERIQRRLTSKERAIFIGDSHLDYSAAIENDFDFIFLSGYTDMDNWRSFCEQNKLPNYPDFPTLKRNYEL